MKLIRFGQSGQEQPGVETSDGTRLDCRRFGEDWNEAFFANDGLSRLVTWLQQNENNCPLVAQDERLGPPVARPSKLVCIGLNYATHAKESGMDIPEEPVVFTKSTTSITGPFDDICIPTNYPLHGEPALATETDWEVELAVVIGRECYAVPATEALDYVAGYVVHNDVSERETQLRRGGQWVKGKSYDTFAPLGPYLVSADEIPDPHALRIWLKLNGEIMQDGSTSDLIFDIPTIVSYLSCRMRLLPGDIISTGTPSGVGLGLKPPRYLRPGDIVELGIDHLGVARQTVVA